MYLLVSRAIVGYGNSTECLKSFSLELMHTTRGPKAPLSIMPIKEGVGNSGIATRIGNSFCRKFTLRTYMVDVY